MATDDGVTMHVRRGVVYVATGRWTERGLASLAFVDHGSTLLGWRHDETLLTAWRVGAPSVTRALPTSDTPRSYACETGRNAVPWMRSAFAYDVPPRAPRTEHGLLGTCDGAEIHATDADEFADYRTNDHRWARAVAERYGFSDAAPRVWRAPWGDRVAAWTYEGFPRRVYNYRFDVRVIEHGDTLYRIEMETLHEGTADPESFPNMRYEVALDRGRLDALFHAMFDPRSSDRTLATASDQNSAAPMSGALPLGRRVP